MVVLLARQWGAVSLSFINVVITKIRGIPFDLLTSTGTRGR